MILREPLFLLFLILIPLIIALWSRRRGRLSGLNLLLRIMIVALLVLALAQPTFAVPSASEPLLVVLVDQSDSLGDAGREELWQQAEEIRRQHDGETQLITFGADVAAAAADVSGDQTDIAAALRAARGILAAGGGRIVLLSDGEATRGDALAEAHAAAAADLPIDTLAYLPPPRDDIWLREIITPRTLREGEEFIAEVVVMSNTPATARVELYAGDQLLTLWESGLMVGENRFSYTNTAGRPGVLTLRAVLSGEPDAEPRNNSSAAAIVVAAAPTILLVEGQPGIAAPLRAGLRTVGVNADLIAAAAIPGQLSPLDPYEAVVLVDVMAGNLTLDQMATLREFVRSEGRGLLATGGRSSFTLGGYKGTPLEEVLPVLMDPPPRPERSDVTMLLLIDQSASMGPEIGRSKFVMAKESALLATESLRDEDRLGVLAFDTNQRWVVPFQLIGSGLSTAEIQAQISQLPLGGGTDILAALEIGLRDLEVQPGSVRHAVLLTDGRSFTDDRVLFRSVIERARAQNITLSSIAIGSDADTELLQDLAQWGAGRYYFADTPEAIPRLTLLESEIARAEPQVEGAFRAEQLAPHPALRVFTPEQIPALGGYVATTIKPEAELVLQSPDGDPVLATWQYGLGRAVAWTPSIESPWAPNWLSWPEYGQFWAQLIRYTLPEVDSGLLQIQVIPNGSSVTLVADSVENSGAAFDLATTQATITLPDGSTRTVTLHQSAPGRYSQELRLAGEGAYAIDVRQIRENRQRAASAGYVQPYAPEYLPPSGRGAALLAAVSGASGGDVLQAPAANMAPPPPIEQRETATDLWPWLVLAAAILWPIEVAAQRGWLRLR